MSEPNHAYYIALCYEAYFGKAMDVEADNVLEACQIAMESADDDAGWKDTLVSSTHWIECIDYGAKLVPEEFSAAAIRCGGAVLMANSLRDMLLSLLHACDRHPDLRKAVAVDIERAWALLKMLPDRIVVA